MPVQLLSQATSPQRLRDNGANTLFRRVFAIHLGLEYMLPPEERKPLAISELEKLALVPLVFGLLPTYVLTRRSGNDPIKPHIEAHLRNLDIPADALLLDVLKRVSDQYLATRGGRKTVFNQRKMGMAGLRAGNMVLYKQILSNQAHRCRNCGSPFDGTTEETLDHMLPWRLVGDVTRGTNWQILCRPCNSGKKDYLSSFQSSEALNWMYSRGDDLSHANDATEETRYVVLAQRRICGIPDCGVTPMTGQLKVTKMVSSGIAIADNLAVLCDGHFGDARYLMRARTSYLAVL